MKGRCRSFEEFRYTDRCQGNPCLAAVGQDEVIVGDWSGNLVRVRLSPFGLVKTVFAAGKLFGSTPVNNLFRSLAVADGTSRCAAATRGAHAVVWDSGEDAVRQAAPEVGPVHSVAWHGGKHLLLGTGDYPLGAGAGRQARLELWEAGGDGLSCVDRVALPGTCVDAIAVSEDGPREIVVFSGMRSQTQGFVSVLDATSLLPRSVFDVPLAVVRRVECTEEIIFVCHAGGVRAMSRKDGGEKWNHETAGECPDFAYDADARQLLLSTGQLISAGNGRVVENWPVLADCCCVRPRPEGGFVGVSKSGAIGVWESET